MGGGLTKFLPDGEKPGKTLNVFFFLNCSSFFHSSKHINLSHLGILYICNMKTTPHSILKGTSHDSIFQFSLFSTLADIFAV